MSRHDELLLKKGNRTAVNAARRRTFFSVGASELKETKERMNAQPQAQAPDEIEK